MNPDAPVVDLEDPYIASWLNPWRARMGLRAFHEFYRALIESVDTGFVLKPKYPDPFHSRLELKKIGISSGIIHTEIDLFIKYVQAVRLEGVPHKTFIMGEVRERTSWVAWQAQVKAALAETRDTIATWQDVPLAHDAMLELYARAQAATEAVQPDLARLEQKTLEGLALLLEHRTLPEQCGVLQHGEEYPFPDFFLDMLWEHWPELQALHTCAVTFRRLALFLWDTEPPRQAQLFPTCKFLNDTATDLFASLERCKAVFHHLMHIEGFADRS